MLRGTAPSYRRTCPLSQIWSPLGGHLSPLMEARSTIGQILRTEAMVRGYGVRLAACLETCALHCPGSRKHNGDAAEAGLARKGEVPSGAPGACRRGGARQELSAKDAGRGAAQLPGCKRWELGQRVMVERLGKQGNRQLSEHVRARAD